MKFYIPTVLRKEAEPPPPPMYAIGTDDAGNIGFTRGPWPEVEVPLEEIGNTGEAIYKIEANKDPIPIWGWDKDRWICLVEDEQG